MLGIAIAGLLATSLGNTDPDAGLPEVSAVQQETQKLATESAAEPSRAEGDPQDRGPQVKGLEQQPERANKIRGQVFAGGGAFISNCAYAINPAVPALAVGLGLSKPTGPHTDFLLRGGVQLGLAGCGASSQPTGRGYFGAYYEGGSTPPPPGRYTLGVNLDLLSRMRLGGGSSAWVLDLGARGGVLGTAGTSGTNFVTLLQFVFELGATFGRENEWEILLQLPAGFMINQPPAIFGGASADNDNAAVFSPLLLLAHSF